MQNTAQNIETQTKAFGLTNANLRSIADNLEDRDQRSKCDWVTLGCAKIVAAGLAGSGTIYFAKQNLDTANFSDAINFIQNDDDAYCCGSGCAHIVQDHDCAHNWAIQMPKYQMPEPEE